MVTYIYSWCKALNFFETQFINIKQVVANVLASSNTFMIQRFFETYLFLNKCIYLIYFFNFWLCWVFVAACRLSLVAAGGGYSSLQCAGFSLRWLLLLQSTGSRRAGFSSCGSWALEHRLSSCGSRA